MVSLRWDNKVSSACSPLFLCDIINNISLENSGQSFLPEQYFSFFPGIIFRRILPSLRKLARQELSSHVISSSFKGLFHLLERVFSRENNLLKVLICLVKRPFLVRYERLFAARETTYPTLISFNSSGNAGEYTSLTSQERALHQGKRPLSAC